MRRRYCRSATSVKVKNSPQMSARSSIEAVLPVVLTDDVLYDRSPSSDDGNSTNKVKVLLDPDENPTAIQTQGQIQGIQSCACLSHLE